MQHVSIHDLRREFQNMLGLLKIIQSELETDDSELKEMIKLSLGREPLINEALENLEHIHD